MIEAALAGALLALGVVVLLRGANPQPATLQERIENLNTPVHGDDFTHVDAENFVELRQQIALRLLIWSKGDKMPDVQSDVAAARGEIDAFALDKLYGAIGSGFLSIVAGVWFGLASTLIGGVLVALAGGAIGYNLPDFEIKKKARIGRDEFEVALNSFVSLVSVSLSGGGGLNTAMLDAANVGRGWVFETLQDTLTDSELSSEPAHRSLGRLGRELQVDGLIELAGALGLAGDSGARITETLIARAESGRKRMISDARSEAEKQSANLGIPVGALLIGWVGFLGYPAVVNLVSGLG